MFEVAGVARCLMEVSQRSFARRCRTIAHYRVVRCVPGRRPVRTLFRPCRTVSRVFENAPRCPNALFFRQRCHKTRFCPPFSARQPRSAGGVYCFCCFPCAVIFGGTLCSPPVAGSHSRDPPLRPRRCFDKTTRARTFPCYSSLFQPSHSFTNSLS